MWIGSRPWTIDSSMKLAILGTDADVLALGEAALAAGHQIDWLGDVRPEDAEAIHRLVPGLKGSADWESLLDHRLVDAVLVGRGTVSEDLKAEQLKRLVTDAVPTLIVHPATLSVLTFYELDMGRRESHAVVRHFNPLVGNPNVAELADWVRSSQQLGGTPRAGHPATDAAGGRVGDGRGEYALDQPRPSPEAPGRATPLSEIGAVYQVVCQRFAPDCGREAALRHLARDVEVLRAVAGDVRSVSAVGPRNVPPRGADTNYASLQVQLSGSGAATVRWSIVPTPGQASRVEVTLIGERGTATLRLPPDYDPAGAGGAEAGSLEIAVGDRRESRPLQPWDAPRVAIDALAAALSANATEKSAAASTWQDATIAMEIADAIELSLQKGRTIEIYPQKLTEQLAFRGTMAAFGCGLLFVGLLILVVAGVLGDALNVPLMRFWPWVLLAVLAMFLLLQVVPWLAGKGESGRPDGDRTE
jgi:predicted dehydrogenase